jgi:hypothetical protein
MVTRGRQQPDRQVCPLCAHDDADLVTWENEGPGVWRFTCQNAGGGHPYSWLATADAAVAGDGHEGLAAELGIYDDLVALFAATDPFLEYGIIEHRFAAAHPETYQHLVNTYSHTVHGPTAYSASSFLGGALGQLARRGDLVKKACRATGYWAYNGSLQAYSLPPGPPDGQVQSWGGYAALEGFSPMEWPALSHDGGDYFRPLHAMVTQIIGVKPNAQGSDHDADKDPETGERSRVITGGWRRPTSPRRRI